MENVTVTMGPVITGDDVTPCDSENQVLVYALYGFAAGIILLLALLEKRNNREKCGCLGGHPGLVIPVNLLDHNDDRVSVAAAFGSMASVCFNLFTTDGNFANLKSVPAWSKTLYIMGSVVIYGLLYYPVFACLSTKWMIIGNFLGASFSGCLFVFNLKTVLNCAGSANESVPGQIIATQTPVLICLCFLVVRFVWKFIHHTYLTVKGRRILEETEKRLSEPHNVSYVRNLLYAAPYTTSDEHRVVKNLSSMQVQSKIQIYMKKISTMLYKNDPLFKYSPKIIAIFVVALICVYQFDPIHVSQANLSMCTVRSHILLKMTCTTFPHAHMKPRGSVFPANEDFRFLLEIFSILVLMGVKSTVDLLHDFSDNSTSGGDSTSLASAVFELKLFLKIYIGCVLFSFVVSLLFTIWSTFQIFTNYRLILKAMFKGDFKALHFKRSDFYAQTIVSYCLSYGGSQIAYLLWGYLVSVVFLTVVCLLIAYLVVLPLTGDVPFVVFKYIALNILPGFVIIGVFRVFQFLWSGLLVQKIDIVNDTGQPTTKRVLALNNRKAFHNLSFFLFLFYIVLGIFGCFFTIIKGIALGVAYLSRLDRCRLMSGFESFDAAYLYFISFMYVEESHRHPVLLVFCDTLLEKHRINKRVDLRNLTSSTPNSYSTFDSISTLGRSLSTLPRARLRWLKAYTLIRNPSLIVDDDQGFEKVGQKDDLSNGSVPYMVLM